MKDRTSMGVMALTLMGTGVMSWAAEAPTVLPEVVVTGKNAKKGPYIQSDASLIKMTQPLLDTPQSVSVISGQLLQDQHATTLRDAVRNVAGLSIAAGEGGAQGDSLTLRGFTARNDIFLDGMRDFGSYYRDTFNYEKVEVLKGPASVAFGRGSTGGVINQVSKMPEKHAQGEINATWGTGRKQRLALDLNEPVPHLGQGTSFRLNAFEEMSGVSGRDIVETRHYGIAPSLEFGLGTPTRVTWSFLHEQSDDVPDYGIPWLFNAPAPVNYSNYYGFKSDFLKTSADIHTLKIEHDLDQNNMIRDQARYGIYTRVMRATEPKISGSPTLSTPLSNIVVARNELNTNSTETFLQNQLDLVSKFKTGGLEHNTVIGMEVGKETSEPIRFTISGVPTTNLQTPNTAQNFSGTSVLNTNVKLVSNTLSFYGMDTVKFDNQWSVMGGLRWDQFKTDYRESVANVNATSTDQMLSWRGSLIYKPIEDGSFYLSYGNSFNPSAEALSLSAPTASLAPEENIVLELGTKWELLKKKFSLRSAIFRAEKRNARETNPSDATQVILSGDQLVEGFEVEGVGSLTEEWQVTFGYAYLDSKVLKSNFFPTAVGQPLANVPRNTFNLWSSYTFPSKVQVGAGMNYVSARRANNTTNVIDATTGLPREVPSYVVFNAMIACPLGKEVELQLNLNNLTNVQYIDQVQNSHLVPGESQTALLSVNYKF